MKKRQFIFDLFMLLLSIFLTVGVLFLFHACGQHEDGKFAACHWAERTVFGVGIVLSFITFFNMLSKNYSEKVAFSTSIGFISLLAFATPGILIDICKMPSMICVSAMRPAVMIISMLIFVVSIVNRLFMAKEHKEA